MYIYYNFRYSFSSYFLNSHFNLNPMETKRRHFFKSYDKKFLISTIFCSIFKNIRSPFSFPTSVSVLSFL